MHEKNNKIPEFYMIGLFARKVFFFYFFGICPRFLHLCIFFVLLAWFKLRENFAHVTGAGFVRWLTFSGLSFERSSMT